LLYFNFCAEGPIAHSQPAYARVPGIRVYGMTCVRQPSRNGKDYSWMNKSRPDITRVEKPSKILMFL